MKRLNKDQWMEQTFVTCECGYNNKKEWVNYSGTCNKCRKVLDNKAYFIFNMKRKLRIK